VVHARVAAGAGAITGAITGLAGPEAGAAAKFGLSIAGSVAGGAAERALNGERVLNAKEMGKDALAGVIGASVEGQAERSMASTVVRKATSTVIDVTGDTGRRGSPSQPQQQTLQQMMKQAKPQIRKLQVVQQ